MASNSPTDWFRAFASTSYGKLSFRAGARSDEQADVTVEVTARAARELNLLRNPDPTYQATWDRFLSTGVMQIDGDPTPLGGLLDAAHDPIVDRTI